MMALNWYEVLHFKKCVNCGSPKPKRKCGGTKTFCPFCEAKLPDVVVWHLDTARKGKWYMNWYRFALALFRRSQVK